MNIASIEKATGQTWDEWLEFFDSIGARELSHHEIAQHAYDHIVKSGAFDDAAANQDGRQNPSGWWSQNVTVAYEQHIGRRVPGQRSDGTFEVTVSKTLDGSMDDALAWWEHKVADQQVFNGVEIVGEPDISKTAKWRYWRVNLADGCRVGVTITAKGTDKAQFSVSNFKLPSPEAVEHWRAYWRQFLAD